MLEPFQCSRHWTQGGPEWGAALARAERVGTAFTGEFYLADWTNPVPMRHVDQDDAWKPEDDLNRDQMFFRWKIDLERTDD